MKKITHYNKLVRDRIPEVLEKKGIATKTHSVDGSEYFEYLLAKLEEEVQEFVKDQNEEELADVLEVINAIIAEKNFSNDSIETIRLKKLADRGGFAQKIILDHTEE